MLLHATQNLKGLEEAIKSNLGLTRQKVENACKRNKVPYAYCLYWLSRAWANDWSTPSGYKVTKSNWESHMAQSWNWDCSAAVLFIHPVHDEDSGYKLA